MLFRSLFSGLLLLGLSACSPSVTPPAEVAPASTPADMPAATPVAATPATTPTTAPTTAPAPPEPAAGLAAAPANPALAPRPGVDYDVLPTPQPTYGQGKIEVAEVFSYRCIHCAEFQPAVNAWMASKPADVRFEYVPAVFGGTWDDFARAYFAAEVLGVLKQTHDPVFKAVFVDQLIKTGTQDELADVYAKLGVDRAKFLATMQSFGVTAKLNRAKQFALRNGVASTPTIIVNGKYRANVTTDRGFPGLLATVDHLVAMERAALAAPAATTAGEPATDR